MKKTFLKKIISAGVVAATIGTLVPLGVSAHRKIGTLNTNQAEDNTLSDYNDNTVANESETISSTTNNSEAKTELNDDNNNETLNYSNKCGVKKKGWVNIDDVWYYFDKNGNVKTGWIKDHGRIYYADSTGARQTGVIKISGKVYYFNKSGVMQTGRVKIGDKIYKFARNGQAVRERIPAFEKEFDSNNNLVKPDNEINSGNNSDSNNSNGNEDLDNNIEKPDNTDKPSDTEKPDDNIQGGGNDTEVPDNSEDNNDTVNKPDNSEGNQDNNGTVNKPGNSQGTQGSTGENNSSNNSGSTHVEGLPVITEKYKVTVQSSAENKILELMNQKRTEAGLKPLTMDNTLLSVARYKSNHMIQNGYFSHTNPDGTTWTNWLKDIGYKYTATGENIAYNSYDPVELFNQWWNSSGHRENMMNPSYTKVGIGVVYGNGKYMGTQTFAG